MQSAGIWLLILGVGVFVLSCSGVPMQMLGMFAETFSLLAAATALAGAVLLAVSFLRDAPHPQQQK